ncbi:MAG TPA: hypothetical protein VFU60_09595 [Ktedonobacterales bacterium]|jgi:hypothetical protein|nr:hypothetical protein [Ktedonobacterales bacterium]
MRQQTTPGAQLDTRQDSAEDTGNVAHQGVPRGVLIVGIAGAAVTAINVYVSGIFAALACLDTCSSVGAMVASSPGVLLWPPLLVAPSLALILVGWIWELTALRRMRRQGALVVVALAPLIALAVGLALAALDAVNDGVAPAAFTAIHLWVGGFALTLWPLLVSVVAFILRERRPALNPR